MDEMEGKISAMLNNPQLMQQIMTMAQSLGDQQSASPRTTQETSQQALPQIDPAMVKVMTGLMGQNATDKREQALLQALGSYISGDRIRRLERAMQAARMAKIVTSVIGQQGLLGSGR